MAQFCVEESVLEILEMTERRSAANADAAVDAMRERASAAGVVDDGAVEPPPFVPVTR